MKYFLNTDTTELQGGRHDGDPHTTRYDPRMDWNAEDKQAAWAFYRERLEQYFVIAGTPKEARVTHILFYGGNEASEWWTALKDQVEGNKDEADTCV